MISRHFHVSEGWRRVVLAVSVIWILVSNALYFSDLGSTSFSRLSLTDFESNYSTPAPAWMVVWYRATLGLLPHLYQSVTSDVGNSTTSYTAEYSALGHAVFVVLPLLVLLAFTALAAWVATGFTASKESGRKPDA